MLALLEQVRLRRLSDRLLNSLVQRGQSSQVAQVDRVEKFAEELRSSLLSVLIYGERLLTGTCNQQASQRDINCICAHTRFSIDLIDRFASPSLGDTSSDSGHGKIDELLLQVQAATKASLQSHDRVLRLEKVPAGIEETEYVPTAELPSLLTALVECVAAGSSSHGPLRLSVDFLPIVVNSTLQFTLTDDARAIPATTRQGRSCCRQCHRD